MCLLSLGSHPRTDRTASTPEKCSWRLSAEKMSASAAIRREESEAERSFL